MRKDQARRLKYQEKQRIQAKAISEPNHRKYDLNIQGLNKAQLEAFARKLVH